MIANPSLCCHSAALKLIKIVRQPCAQKLLGKRCKIIFNIVKQAWLNNTFTSQEAQLLPINQNPIQEKLFLLGIVVLNTVSDKKEPSGW